MVIPFLVFVFALLVVLGAYLAATRGSDAKRKRLQKRLNEALLHSAHTEDVEVVLAKHERGRGAHVALVVDDEDARERHRWEN